MNKCFLTILSIWICAVSIVVADTFKIGEKEINIPAPVGFVRVTPDMSEVDKLVSVLSSKSINRPLAYYIEESDAPLALKGEMPQLNRTFFLTASKPHEFITVGRDEFAQFKDIIKNQNSDIFEEIKAKLPNHWKDVSQEINKEFSLDFSMNNIQMIPLNPHYVTDDALAYAMFINYGSENTLNNDDEIVTSTATILNPSGVVLCLACYGSPDDLGWTMESSMEWTKLVLASNEPPPVQTLASGKSSFYGLNWDRVFQKMIIGSVIGAIIGTVFFLRKKKAENTVR